MDLLIERSVLFGNPQRTQVRVSPSGEWLSFLAPVEGVLNVWVAPVGQLQAARPITKDTHRGIREHSWAPGSERVLYLQDSAGDENWHVYSVDPANGVVVDLTPYDAVAARIEGTSPRWPHHVLIAVNDRVPQLHDWHRVDVRTGERVLVLENPGYVGALFDWDFAPRMIMGMTPDGGLTLATLTAEGPKAWLTIPPEDALTTGPIGYTADGQTLYLLDSTGRDTNGLFAVDVASGERTLLSEDPRADLSSAWMHPETGVVQAAVHAYDRRHIEVLDQGIAEAVATLEAYRDGELELTARTSNDELWVCAWLRDDGPIHYALFHTATGEIVSLFDSQEALAAAPLTRRRSVIVPCRDGLEMVGYLSLPRWVDQQGRPASPLPMVLLVHGGPWARDVWGYEPQHQLLANRGYAVLSVNFRGSTGFGKGFVNAGNFEWAGKMHEDLLDAVDWAVAQGIADPDKVAIMGGSYGGYAALVGLTFTPEVFAAGVDIVGPSNIITLLETIPPYWAPVKAQFTSRVGTDETEEGRAALWARSPLSKVEQICRPLLIAQGANDPRVKQAESDQIVAAMKRAGIPVRYALFPDEGHGFARPENRIAFMAITEAFLAEHLGGRAAEATEAIAASTVALS